jgi:hypothetical protein
VKKTKRNQPIRVITQTCMEKTKENSLCSYLYLKLAKTSRFFFYLLFFLLQNQRTGGQNRFWGEVGEGVGTNGGRWQGRGRRMKMVPIIYILYVNEKNDTC